MLETLSLLRPKHTTILSTIYYIYSITYVFHCLPRDSAVAHDGLFDVKQHNFEHAISEMFRVFGTVLSLTASHPIGK